MRSDGRATTAAGLSTALFECDLAQDGLEASERGQILGGAARDEPGTVVVAAYGDRKGADGESREPFEEGEREPGEVGAARDEKEACGARPQNGSGARVRGLIEVLENCGKGRQALARGGRRGRIDVGPRGARVVRIRFQAARDGYQLRSYRVEPENMPLPAAPTGRLRSLAPAT